MKKLLYLSLITSTCICLVTAIKAQCLTIDYDASGNRYSRATQSFCTVADLRKGEEAVETQKESKITIYPNPTNNKVMVNLDNFESYEGARLMVYDAMGRLVISNENLTGQNELNLGSYASGQYLIKVYIEDKVFDRNITKE